MTQREGSGENTSDRLLGSTWRDRIGHHGATPTARGERNARSLKEHADAVSRDRYTTAVRITSEVKRVMGELAELAPLHNPASLTSLRRSSKPSPTYPK